MGIPSIFTVIALILERSPMSYVRWYAPRASQTSVRSHLMERASYYHMISRIFGMVVDCELIFIPRINMLTALCFCHSSLWVGLPYAINISILVKSYYDATMIINIYRRGIWLRSAFSILRYLITHASLFLQRGGC